MAQTGYTPISLYYSTTASTAPTAGNLVAGELAINTADGKLFYKDSSGVVQVIAGKAGAGVAGGSTTQVQYNSSGSLAGSANLTFNGTTLTTANDASISGLTVGQGALAGTGNTAFGITALSTNSSGGFNTAIGQNALKLSTSGGNSVAVGYGSLSANTTGSLNVAAGVNSLVANTTGGSNTALGTQALQANTTASNNTAVGYQAGYSNTTATGNSFFGYQVGYGTTTGTDNVAVGGGNPSLSIRTLQNNTTGSANTAMGNGALASNTTASSNTAVGYQAGYNITTGGGNTYIGNVSASGGAAASELVVGTPGATGKGNNTGFIYAGGGGTYQGNNSTLWSITSDQRLKKNIVDNFDGLNKITAIQVRNFEYRLPEEITGVSPDQAIQKTGVQLGAIAQELQQGLPECVKQESTGIYTVDADPLIWYLVNAVKELNATVVSLQAQVTALTKV